MMADIVYPRGGWSRAASYVMHRLRRLPDPPHRIARGIAAGVFTSFTPLFGMHFVVAAALAWVMQGNIVAALLATFFGNPLTFPIIAGLSIELGRWMVGGPERVRMNEVFDSFSDAANQIWHNFLAIFTSAEAHWDELPRFFEHVFWPYLVGGLVPGVICGVIAYMLARPAVSVYQRARIKRMKAKYEKKHKRQMQRG